MIKLKILWHIWKYCKYERLGQYLDNRIPAHVDEFNLTNAGMLYYLRAKDCPEKNPKR